VIVDLIKIIFSCRLVQQSARIAYMMYNHGSTHSVVKVNELRDSHKLLVTPNREFERKFGGKTVLSGLRQKRGRLNKSDTSIGISSSTPIGISSSTPIRISSSKDAFGTWSTLPFGISSSLFLLTGISSSIFYSHLE
jgi:hypothetical protein